MSQTAYTVNMAAAAAGLIADMFEKDVMSFITPSDSIPFGLAVARNSTDDYNCKLPAASGDDLIGIALSTMAKEIPLGAPVQTVQYVAGDAVSVMREGRVWVLVEETVLPGSPVFVRFTAGAGGSQKGAFRASADSASAVAWTKAKYLTNAVAGALALVEVRM